ncbi:MAG: hypothetical protein P8L73_06260 [SAR86 cluster bacterium]|jgi:hypothetical protein|nr:hypothetical protein [Gammaproteobacteria bacterium]MDG0966478.1 hypothetical protein [SAR86 cluster bacterium]MDG2347757.1 hypothetical protein [SAR86 cluster bacterium]|tara:strand:+ start:3559 stop:3807 length:249 start_codon:yes stop_codon:yes gene_type:complete
MRDISQRFQKCFPEIRDRKDDETTPEYLNYIDQIVTQAHEDILKLSPLYQISSTFRDHKPLDLGDIKTILSEVKKYRSSEIL